MADLWVVTVRERSGQVTQLCYRDGGLALAVAETCKAALNDWHISLNDDWGTSLLVRVPEIASVMTQHLSEVAEGQHEVTLFQSRAKVRLQEKADADPVLKAQAAKVRYAQAHQQAQGFGPPISAGPWGRS